MTFSMAGAVLPARTTLSNNSVTTVLPAGIASMVASIRVSPNSGTTPTFNVSVYDGTTRRYLCYGASSAAAGTTIEGPFGLNRAERLEVTSGNASGLLDVHVEYVSGIVGAGSGSVNIAPAA